MKNTKIRKNTWGRLISYLKKYLPQVILTVVLSAVTVVLSLYIPILCGKAIDCMVGEGQVDFESIASILVKIAVCALSCGVLQWIMNTVNNKITYSVIRDVRRDAFDTLLHLPISYVDANPHGSTVSRIVSDVDQFADGLLLGFTQFFSGIVTIICTLVFMIILNPAITAIVVVLTPLSLFVASFVAKSTFSMFRRQSEIRGELTGYINEMVGSQPVVRAFSREEAVLEKFSGINTELEKCSLRAIFFSSLTNPTTRFINNIVYAVVCLAGGFASVAGVMSVGGLSSFLAYASQYAKPFNEISGVVTELQNALACAERIFELIDEKRYTPDKAGAISVEHVNGDVELKDVDFSYSPDKELIRDLDLYVESGNRVAIVGPTGCGKTTIINLLMRFYDVDAGKISIDGVDITDIKRDSLYKTYGMVLQDTWIMNGTVRDNIKMGREATEEEIVSAAKAAHAHSFIKRLPNGYDTVISDEGGALSAGQRQLLCIARVMLAVPPILILDEATSSIDTRTELKIQDAFASLMKGRTSFIVAHRLSTIREADVILVMKDGKIIEKGKHEDLLAADGFYKKLWGSQFESVSH